MLVKDIIFSTGDLDGDGVVVLRWLGRNCDAPCVPSDSRNARVTVMRIGRVSARQRGWWWCRPDQLVSRCREEELWRLARWEDPLAV